MTDETKPTSGVEVARLLAGDARQGLENAYEAHNAVAAVVAMYGSIVQHLKGEVDELRSQKLALVEAHRVLSAQLQELRRKVVVVQAPGDLCGGTRTLSNGRACPGCRACA
jgi:hypothetical protein